MSEGWMGCRVSLDCGGLGHFQGVISKVSLSDQSITLRTPFQNGRPCKYPEVTLAGSDIQDLRILESKAEVESQEETKEGRHSSVVVEKKKQKLPQGQPARKPNPEVKDDRRGGGGPQPLMSLILENKGHSLEPKGVQGAPKGLQGGSRHSPRPEENYNRHRAYSGTRTPIRSERLRLRDEDCFSSSVQDMDEDFDFEKNLALFDKQTILSEIEQELSNKPDIIRLVDHNRRAPEPKYKNDENVLGNNVVTEYRQIDTGEVMETEFVTDSGLVVPAVSRELRDRLQAALERHGLGSGRQTELMGRAATELCLQLLGGQHRLAANNAHQLPLVVLLCGRSRAAGYALTAARHLAGHGVRTQVYLPEGVHYPPELDQELRLYRLTGGKVVTRAKELPAGSVDAIVTALEDEELWSQQRLQPWHRAAVAWAEGFKAPVLAVDPPPELPVLNTRMTLVSLLPLAQPAQCGNLYLANLGVPRNIFKEVGIKYSSPFGAKFVIALHPLQL